jgi:hypothetical protein
LDNITGVTERAKAVDQVVRYRRLAQDAMGRARAAANAFERSCWLEIADSYENLANERQTLLAVELTVLDMGAGSPAPAEADRQAPAVILPAA